MCLFPIIRPNKKYLPNKKNQGRPPLPRDMRLMEVPLPCHNCEECRKQKANEWRQRGLYEITQHKYICVTLTFTDDDLQKLAEEIGSTDSNEIAHIAVKRFRDRYRKAYKKSIRHFAVTELGQGEPKKAKNGTIMAGTERIHIHGIFATELKAKQFEKIWEYGNIWVGQYVNARTINYLIKYVNKIDQKHKGYRSKIFVSRKFGEGYQKTWNWEQNRFKGEETNDKFKYSNGTTGKLNKYYRDKRYTPDQRETLRLISQDKQVKYLNGRKYEVKTIKQNEDYQSVLEYFQIENKKKGFGDRSNEWKKKNYPASLKIKPVKPIPKKINNKINNHEERDETQD